MYLNQDIQLESRIDDMFNPYGEFVYEFPRKIKGRKQYKVTEVSTQEGKILKSSFEIYTKEPIKVDDKVDGKLVIFAESYISLNGKAVMYRSLTV